MNNTYFIFGHGSTTPDVFDALYAPIIDKALENPNSRFVVGDFKGTDTLAQDYLKVKLEPIDQLNRVTVFHMFKKPRYLASDGFKTQGGYIDDTSRDNAMTKASTHDIGFLLSNRLKSGTAKNILRRHLIDKENII